MIGALCSCLETTSNGTRSARVTRDAELYHELRIRVLGVLLVEYTEFLMLQTEAAEAIGAGTASCAPEAVLAAPAVRTVLTLVAIVEIV